MTHRPGTVATVGAFLVALAAFGTAFLIVDPTPLLVEPTPDLDWPLGAIGLAGGLWSASRITALAVMPNRVLGRAALWLMLPLLLSFGLVALVDRVRNI